MQISVKDAAAMLGVSETALYRWIERSEIPFHKINDSCRFNRAELLEWATGRGMGLPPDAFSDVADDDDAAEPPRLADALRNGGVLYGVEGNTNAEVLRSIVERMVLPDGNDREWLYQMLVAREALGSTGIGKGIAIPHARNPVVLEITRPSVTVCFLKNPIDFKSPDGIPVSILFTIITPTVQTHLRLISRIVYALRGTECLSALEKRESPDKILAAFESAESPIAGGPK